METTHKLFWQVWIDPEGSPDCLAQWQKFLEAHRWLELIDERSIASCCISQHHHFANLLVTVTRRRDHCQVNKTFQLLRIYNAALILLLQFYLTWKVVMEG